MSEKPNNQVPNYVKVQNYILEKCRSGEYAVGCRMVHKDLIYEILSVVEEIPEGCVATSRQIARLIGRDKNSRLVARVLSHASNYGDFPCHRVVNHAGRLVPGWPEQAFLLRQEGVELKDAMHVDLKKYQWEC